MIKTNSLLLAAAVLIVAPAVFAEDAYIESDGTQFLVGDYHLQPNAKFELDFQLTVVSNSYRLFGLAGAGKDATNTAMPRCELYIGTDAKGVLRFSLNASKVNGTRQAGNFYAADTLRHTIIVDYAASTDQFQVWTDGVLSDHRTFSSAFHDQPSPYPLALFGRNTAKSGAYDVDYKTPMRVYGFKIYDNGTLMRDYFPCLVEGIPGLKDRVTGRFITSESVTPFAYGGDITDEKDDAYISTVINTNSLYLATNCISPTAGLKNIFLDTGYTIKPTTRVELDYASLEPNWTADNKYKSAPWFMAAFGKNANNADLNFFYASLGGSDGCCCYRIGTGTQTSAPALSLKAAHKLRRTVSMNSNSIQVVTAGYTNLAATVSSSKVITDDLDANTLTIGARWSKDSRFIPMKIYGLKIYESDELVKDYRPFISNSVPGLVNSRDETDRLYASTHLGGGRTNIVFEAGGDITDDAEEQEMYLQFDGVKGHSISTGYSLTKDSCVDVDFAFWNTTYNGPATSQDVFGQGSSTEAAIACLFARLTIYSTYKFSYIFKDYNGGSASPGNTQTGIPVDNNRYQFKFDGLAGKYTVTSGGRTLKDNITMDGARTMGASTRTLHIGGSYTGGTRPAWMKLYSFKISETNVLQRSFVPCTHEGQAGLYELCEGKFYPLTGGRVCGKGYKGQSEHGTFTVSPQPGKITKGSSPYELSCIAPGASSFEWYEDDKLIEGATTDSYAVQWTNKKPHTRTYKVVPVYNVFNTRVKGDAATAQVELTPVGILISVQ